MFHFFNTQKTSSLQSFLLFSSILLIFGCKQTLPECIAIPYEKLPETIQFNLDVKPIISDKCYHCHGPDEKTRKAGLRFDTEDGLFAKSTNGKYAFKKGSLRKSESIKRILSDDPNYVMPPEEAHLSLTAKEKAILIKWVEQGAKWEKRSPSSR